MRNTKEWYFFIDKLIDNSKRIFFYLDNKYYTPDDALITGIKAILSEEYSRELSKKINNAHRNRQQSKGRPVITSATWGYDKINKKIVINEHEAKIVKRIFELCTLGYGSRTISKMLYEEGYHGRKSPTISVVTIRKILRNPLYMGTQIMNKTHFDFNTKKTIILDESKWIYNENCVPPIIDELTYQKANEKMDERVDVKSYNKTKKRIGINKGKHELSSKIVCGECGSNYWRKFRRNVRTGEPVIDWYCSEYITHGRKTPQKAATNKKVLDINAGGCDNINIKEDDLNNILCCAYNKLFGEKDRQKLIENWSKIARIAWCADNIINDITSTKNDIDNITKQRGFILDKYIAGIINDDMYKEKDNQLEDKQYELYNKLEALENKVKESSRFEERIQELKNELESNDALNDPEKIHKHINKIELFHDRLVVSFDFFDEVVILINNKRKSCNFISVCIPD